MNKGKPQHGGNANASLQKENGARKSSFQTSEESDIEVDCITYASVTVSNDDLPTVCDAQLLADPRRQDQVGNRLVYGNEAGVSMKQQLNDLQEDFALFKAITEDKLANTENKLANTENKLANTENELANTMNELALLKEASTTYTTIRRRFIANFKRTCHESRMRQSDWDDIRAGNLEAHAGDLIQDAKLFMDSARNDIWLFKDLYGVDPLRASKLGRSDACGVLNAYATIRAQSASPLDPLEKAFKRFVKELEFAEYDCTMLSDAKSPIGQAYCAFWDAHRRV